MSEIREGFLEDELAGLEGSVPDVLAERYATEPMRQIWSPEGQVLIERFVQLTILQAQAELGVDISGSHIADYQAKLGIIDLASITERERITKHDVNARIAEFNALAGHQDIGIAMTSRDHTENTEQLQKRLSLEIVRAKVEAAIGGFASAAATYTTLPITGRTHNVPAQMTTLGKRFASLGEDMIDGHSRLTHHLINLKLRGVKGAVGTQQDMLNLFEGDEVKVDELDQIVAHALGFSAVYNSVGQIYPRSQDLETVQALSAVVGPMSNFATQVRLMQGGGLMTETKKKRVGSNAMPHKINPRTAERVTGFYKLLGGYEAMLRPLAGEQWLEGDVSCSVVRRVALPGSFFATDGAFESGLTVLNGFGLFETKIRQEVEDNLPFLATTKVLTECIKRGVGREDAHEKIREHSFEVVRSMREEGQAKNDLLERLGADPDIPMTYPEIMAAVENPLALTGRTDTQVQRFLDSAEAVLAKSSTAYQPKDIL